VYESYQALWKAVVPWFGAHVLHLARPATAVPSGSGDRFFDWVMILVMLSASIVAAVVWSIFDRRARSYPRLFAAFVLYLRFTLARTLFSYGFDKVIPNQFSPMTPTRLTQFVGEMSPGGFAWTFLGFSVPYEMFAGFAEVTAATLLLFRRTTTLGALIGAAVLTNVFMLNMTFDIPVKQYSAHLLLFCGLLVAFDARRLLDVFVRERATEARGHTKLFTTPRARVAARIGGFGLAIWMIASTFYAEFSGLYEYGRLAPHGPLHGIFEVERVTKNGQIQQPLLTDGTLWRRFATSNGTALARMATDSLVRYRLETDTVKQTATLRNGPDSTSAIILAYTFVDPTHLVLTGRILTDSVEIRLRRRPESSYLLVSRGFHWVSEFPFFR